VPHAGYGFCLLQPGLGLFFPCLAAAEVPHAEQGYQNYQHGHANRQPGLVTPVCKIVSF
jgi:hypothetical protein